MTTQPVKPVNGSLLEQVAKFGVIGVAGFITDVGGFNALRFAGGEGVLYDYPTTAKIISGVAATFVAWLGNRYWTFKGTRRSSARKEFVLFAGVAGIGVLIAAACLFASHHILGFNSPLADNISANGVGLVLATVFRFWAYRTHVFSEEGDHSTLSEIADYAEHHGNHDGAPVVPAQQAVQLPDAELDNTATR